MRSNHLVLIGLFSNFFGWYIVQYYRGLVNIPVESPFRETPLYVQSIIELSVIFFVIVAINAFMMKLYGVKSKNSPKMIDKKDKIFTRKWLYFFLTIGFVWVGVYNIITINISLDNSMRGVGQFERDISSAAERFMLLIYPAFLFYRINYENFFWARLNSIFIAVAISVNSISFGDRRMMFYFLLFYILLYIRENKKNRVKLKY